MVLPVEYVEMRYWAILSPTPSNPPVNGLFHRMFPNRQRFLTPHPKPVPYYQNNLDFCLLTGLYAGVTLETARS